MEPSYHELSFITMLNASPDKRRKLITPAAAITRFLPRSMAGATSFHLPPKRIINLGQMSSQFRGTNQTLCAQTPIAGSVLFPLAGGCTDPAFGRILYFAYGSNLCYTDIYVILPV
jgi:hypothetical protein